MNANYTLFEMELATEDAYDLDMTVAIFFNDKPVSSVIPITKDHINAFLSNRPMSEILPLIEKGSIQEKQFSQYVLGQLEKKFSTVERVEIQIINGRQKNVDNVSSTLEKYQSKYDLSTIERMKLQSKKSFLAKLFRR